MSEGEEERDCIYIELVENGYILMLNKAMVIIWLALFTIR